MSNKKALITGISGQDGSFLSELLLQKGYEVHGLVRRSSISNIDHMPRLHKVQNNIQLHYADLGSPSSIYEIINLVKPDELYNLAAQSDVRISFEIPDYTADVNSLGTLRLLNSLHKIKPECKFYQASTSEILGKTTETIQNEQTRIHPRSPYGVSKVFAYWITVNYREAYGMHTSNGILYNHESERRGENFVTRKITKGLTDILKGKQDCLYLGNLYAKRDWGYAKDYCEAMYLMLQQPQGDEYIIATGETHTIKEFVEEACKYIDYDVMWKGDKEKEIGINAKTNKIFIRIDPKFYRPSEVNLLCGDNSKAKKILNWEPKTSFKELVQIMMQYDLNAL